MTAPRITVETTDGTLEAFQFDQWRVRVFDKAGEPWWVLSDVCEALGIANPRNVVDRLEEDEKSTIHLADGAGGPPRTIINESGLYSVILRSDKPDAKRFKKWVTSEVLPAIRKTGEFRARVKAPLLLDHKPPRLPNGKQLQELRLLVEKGRISSYQLQLLLSIATPRTPALPEVPATREEAEAAFHKLGLKFSLPALPSGALEKASRAAAGAVRRTLRSVETRAQAQASQPPLAEEMR